MGQIVKIQPTNCGLIVKNEPTNCRTNCKTTPDKLPPTNCPTNYRNTAHKLSHYLWTGSKNNSDGVKPRIVKHVPTNCSTNCKQKTNTTRIRKHPLPKTTLRLVKYCQLHIFSENDVLTCSYAFCLPGRERHDLCF